MKIYNRISSFFYSNLPWLIPGVLFIFANSVMVLSSSHYQLQGFLMFMGVLGKFQLILYTTLCFIVGMLIDFLSKPLHSYLFDNKKSLKTLCHKNQRVMAWNNTLCEHYKKETLDPQFIINEAKFLYESGESQISNSKQLGLYKLFRNLTIPFCYLNFMLIIAITYASVYFLLLLLFVLLTYASISISGNKYDELLEKSFFIISEHVKEL